MDGWFENEFLKKTSSPKFGLESLLGTFDFGVCQKGKSRSVHFAREEKCKQDCICFQIAEELNVNFQYLKGGILRTIGAFKFTFFPKAVVEFNVQGRIRPR